ncbi:Quinone-dependent D-lactate dehydrogenase [Sodalis praecaptivus]
MLIHWLGTARLPALFALKNLFDLLAERLRFLPAHRGDRLLQFLSHLLPNPLPARMNNYRDRYEHHLLLKVSAEGVSEAQDFLSGFFAEHEGAFFSCTEEEGKKAFYTASPPRGPRFATAPCTLGRWRISSRWTSLCGAMMTSGLSNYRRRWTSR